jgi:hypothetical protein
MIQPATIMVVAVIGAATLVICVGIIAYARGYRAGIKWCTDELGSVADEAAKVRAAVGKRRVGERRG